MEATEEELEETPIEEIMYCRDCIQRDGFECGITGIDVLDDSICFLEGII